LGGIGGVGEGIGEVLDPLGLEPGVGDGESAGAGEAVEGFGGREAVGAEEAGDEEAGAADSGVAVGSDGLAGAEVAMKAVDEGAELVERGGDGVVGDGEPVVVDADLAGKLGFVFEAEGAGFVGTEERDEGVEALIAQAAEGGGEMPASGGTGDDGGARKCSRLGEGEVSEVYPIGNLFVDHKRAPAAAIL